MQTAEELTEKLSDLESMNAVLKDVFSTLQVDQTLHRILAAALQLSNADQGAILLIGDLQRQDGNTLIREGGSKDEKLDPFLNRLLGGWTYTYKKPLSSNNLIETFGEDTITDKYRDIVSAMSIPLVIEDNIIGVINLISIHADRLFAVREVRLISLLAEQCARFIENAKLHEALFEENVQLKKAVAGKYDRYGIIGSGENMRKVFALLDRVIPTDVRVLLAGESGTGKELVAKVIHYNGSRKDNAFVTVDCGALPANLLESELFGYVKGAFTGADRDRKGLFEAADKGTLFLDEVGNMPL
jgi:transcriptional regulator with GAF, ATPase, and Fis domain